MGLVITMNHTCLDLYLPDDFPAAPPAQPRGMPLLFLPPLLLILVSFGCGMAGSERERSFSRISKGQSPLGWSIPWHIEQVHVDQNSPLP